MSGASGVGGLLELYWNFIGVDRNFIGTVSLRYCYVIATLLLRYRYVIGRRSRVPDLRSVPLWGGVTREGPEREEKRESLREIET